MNLFRQFKQFFGFGQLGLEKKSLFEQVLISLRRGSLNSRSIEQALSFYAAHELVYACVNKIADVMNDAELVIEKRNQKGEWEPVQGHPMVSLLNKPNSYDVGEDFNRLRVQSEYVAGIAYFEKIYSKAKILVGLEPIIPTTVTPKLNQDKTEIELYKINTGPKKYDLTPDKVLVRRRTDLTNLFFGLAPAQVAMKSINADLGLSDYIEAFFNSDGTPSGILKVLNKNLTQPEIDKAQADWRARYGRNGSSQKGIAVLDQNAEFQKIGSNLDELAAESVSARFESRICSVFGVPPILVGAYVGLLYVNQRASAKESLQDFVTNKISPELKSYRKWLTWNLLPEFENIEDIKADKLRVNFDLSQVGYLQEDLDKLHARARKDFAIGLISQNEARATTKRLPVTDGDKFIWDLKPQFGQFPTNEPTDSEPPKLLPAPTLQKKTFEKSKTFDYEGLTLGREPNEVELLIDLKKIVSDQETAKERTAKILLKFREQLINEAVTEAENFDASNIFSLTLSAQNKINQSLYKAFEAAHQTGKEQIIDDINRQSSAKDFSFGLEIKDLDKETIKKIRQMTDLTISKLLNEIQKRAIDIFVLLESLGIDVDFFTKLKERLTGEPTKWIEQLAGNSTNLLINTGRDEEIDNQKDVIQYVTYSAILDRNTCEACESADGETADEVAGLPECPNPDCDGGTNCRCIHIAVIV